MMVCLDTSFLIDVLNEDEAAEAVKDELDDRQERSAVTPVTAAELWIGAHLGPARELRQAEALLDSLLWLEFDRSCARRAGQLQAERIESGARLGFNDCVIAAMAIEYGHELVTRDEGFEDISELRVRMYRPPAPTPLIA